jgi:hypothetical protein
MRKILFALLMLLTVSIKSQILNVESSRLYNDTSVLSGNFNASYMLNEEGHKTVIFNSGFDVQWKPDTVNIVLVLAGYGRMTSNDFVIKDNKVGHVRYNYKITDRITAEAFAQAMSNHYLLISCRSDLGVGLRFKVIKNPSYKVYVGLLLMKENYIGNAEYAYTDGYRYDWYMSFNLKLADNLHFTNTTYYQPKIGDMPDARISNESMLSIRVLKHFELGENLNYATQSVRPDGISNAILFNILSLTYVF